ncbi:MAG: hypothetical protein ABW022_18675, partial [Actinoplanes sp.]
MKRTAMVAAAIAGLVAPVVLASPAQAASCSTSRDFNPTTYYAVYCSGTLAGNFFYKAYANCVDGYTARGATGNSRFNRIESKAVCGSEYPAYAWGYER